MTNVEICNRALAVIGHDRKIASMTETTAEGQRCAQFYPAALRNVLGAYGWDFASVETDVSISGVSTTWTIPEGLVRLVSVRDDEGRSVRAVRSGSTLTLFNSGTDTISATIRYVSSSDPTGTTIEATLPHLVAEAVVYELASLLFGPMIGHVQDSQGTALFQSYQQLAATKLSAAITAEDAEHAFMGGRRPGDAIKTDLVNRAIAKLGGDTVITDFATDPSPVAARARLLFRTALVETLLSRDWDFAAVELRVSLALDPTGDFSRLHLPPDCVRVCRCLDDRQHPLECRRNRDFFFVRTAGDHATVRYVSDDLDLAEAPEFFLELVTMSLAALLAPTVLHDTKAVAAMEQMLRQGIHEMGFEEANETASPGEWRNPLVACRN